MKKCGKMAPTASREIQNCGTLHGGTGLRPGSGKVQEILAEDPDYARGYVLKGLLWLKKGETDKARDEFLKARDLDPSSGEGDYFYGLTFLNDQDYRMSLSEILKALEKDPNSPKIRLALAYIYFRTRKLSLALTELNQVLRFNRIIFVPVYCGPGSMLPANNMKTPSPIINISFRKILIPRFFGSGWRRYTVHRAGWTRRSRILRSL
jgi:tetratricopeptide (TPR) repeat protein